MPNGEEPRVLIGDLVLGVGVGVESGEEVEKVGEGFGAAGGVFDGEPGASVAVEVVAAEDAEAHGETVVAIGFDFDAGFERARSEGESVAVGVFIDFLTEFAEFADHAGDAVGLLFAGVGDAGDAGRAREQWGNRGEGEKGVGELVEVFGDAGAWGWRIVCYIYTGNLIPTKDCFVTFLRSYRGTYFFKDFDELRITLESLSGALQSANRE